MILSLMKEDILLLEFAIYIKKWLKSYKKTQIYICNPWSLRKNRFLSFEKVKDNYGNQLSLV